MIDWVGHVNEVLGPQKLTSTSGSDLSSWQAGDGKLDFIDNIVINYVAKMILGTTHPFEGLQSWVL